MLEQIALFEEEVGAQKTTPAGAAGALLARFQRSSS
jgi:hypothetical protein